MKTITRPTLSTSLYRSVSSRATAAMLAGLTLMAGALTVVFNPTPVQAQSAAVRDNSANSIIQGGALTPQEFIEKARANNPNDLQPIFSSYGLTPAEYDRFMQTAKMGTAYKDGRVVVDGQVVATDARSIGREKKPYSTTRSIAGVSGTQYYESRHQDVFVPDAIPIMVMFDQRGQYEFGVLTACANPVRATPVRPVQRCDALQRTAVSGAANTYDFSTRATAGNGSTISRVVYDFGDGSATETRTNPTETVRHTYSQPGTYQAKVTVYVTLPGGQESPVTSSTCVSTVTVPKPVQPTAKPAAVYNCTGLRSSRPANSTNNLQYTFTATVTRQNATLAYADFDFGDGITQRVTPAQPTDTEISATHTYAQNGTYTARATTYFTAANGTTTQGTTSVVSSNNGQTSSITTAGSTTTTTGAASNGSDTCEVQITTDQPVTPVSTTPQAPVLPATGVGEFIALFSAVSVIGSVGYYIYTKRRLAQL